MIDDGIGNAVEMLYAVEYCIKNGKKTGVFFNKVSASFVTYLKESYGTRVVLDGLDGVTTANLIHSWLYVDSLPLQFDSYFFVSPNYQNTLRLSETEQYLSIVKRLYPSNVDHTTLTLLKEDYSERLKRLKIETKYIVYPGCASINAVKRWPHYEKLIEILGAENIMVLGGKDDLDNSCAYYYPRWLTLFCPYFLLRRLQFARRINRLGLLSPHAHLNDLKDRPYSFFNVFSWAELVALFRRTRFFIGNDGGLSQLAGACGVSGLMIFGPTSINKNKPYNSNLRPVSTHFNCQPCQFGVNKKDYMARGVILCPYQVRCLYSLTAATIADLILQQEEVRM
ncbi:MAG: glycosyltransferase family 9 protein [Limisphaerales bacterium]